MFGGYSWSIVNVQEMPILQVCMLPSFIVLLLTRMKFIVQFIAIYWSDHFGFPYNIVFNVVE